MISISLCKADNNIFCILPQMQCMEQTAKDYLFILLHALRKYELIQIQSTLLLLFGFFRAHNMYISDLWYTMDHGLSSANICTHLNYLSTIIRDNQAKLRIQKHTHKQHCNNLAVLGRIPWAAGVVVPASVVAANSWPYEKSEKANIRHNSSLPICTESHYWTICNYVNISIERAQ
jgi:hypothetical protein